ncbi:DNA replication and repair protein RecF [SAR86 cluster bacterium]|nr:DNA replication and repair protein RecF [SAR86 cluster bacterium]
MPLKRLHLKNFRLFQDKTFRFSDGINLILGENGSGKTTVLESLNILLTGNSFRAKDTTECIHADKEFYYVSAKGIIKGKDLSLVVENNHNKRLFSKRKLGELSVKKGEFCFLQVVLAKNLKMIDGEPEIRREFFNNLMFHVKPEIKKLHNAYQKALKQRNRSLKKGLSTSEVSLWSKKLSALGLELSLEQYNFFKIFKEHTLESMEKNVSNGYFNYLDKLSLTFSKGWERSKKLEESLLESLERDKALGYTSKGPHRMDYTFTVENKKASSNLSRGQLKILILLVFLSSIKLLKDLIDTEILLMIDDLGSELDLNNLTSIVMKILESDNQVILTGIDGEEMHKSLKKMTNFTQINI